MAENNPTDEGARRAVADTGRPADSRGTSLQQQGQTEGADSNDRVNQGRSLGSRDAAPGEP